MSFVPMLAAADDINNVMAQFLVVILIAVAVGIVILIMYLLTLSTALKRCSPRNRLMEPGMVWLNLIPLFGIVWQFFTVNRVSGSLKNEFDDRGAYRGEGDYGAGLGLGYCILNLASIVPIPFINALCAIAGLVCFIMYWVKISGYSKRLATRSDGYDDSSISGFDDDDDRPRRGRYDDEDDRPRRGRYDDEDDERERRNRYDDDEDRPRRR